MAQAINLQITPSNVMPKIYASQFDIGREIEISLYDGASAYTPPVGTDIRFEGKKPDGNGFSYACTYTGNVVTVVTTDQMTVLAGEIPCELRMSLNGDDIGTLNIIFVIEKSPIDENVPISDTEIPAIIDLARDEQYTAEAWAIGERNGVPVGPEDPAYHNNAKYWAEHAEYGALDDLTDVEITTPTNGQVVTYNGTSQKWENKDIPSDTVTQAIIAPVEGATSLHDYVVGEQLIYNNTLYKVIAPISVNDALVVDTNIEVSPKTVIEQVEDNASDISDIDAEISAICNVYGSKNICPSESRTIEGYGITFSADDKGYMTCSTSNDTRTWNYKYANQFFRLKAGTYFIKAFEKTVYTTGYTGLQIIDSNGNSIFTATWATLLSTGQIFTLAADTDIGVEYKVGDGAYAFMIMDNRIKDRTYVPYAPTNRDCVSYKANSELGAHNFLPNLGINQTVQNVTVTVNANKTLSTNNTANANGYYDIFPKSSNLFLDKGKSYRLTDGTEGDTSVVGVQLFFYDSNNASLGFYEKGQVFTVPNNTTYIYVALRIQNGVNFSGKTFKPMITAAEDTCLDYAPHAMTNRELTLNTLKYKDVDISSTAITSESQGVYTAIVDPNLPSDAKIVSVTWISSGWEADVVFIPYGFNRKFVIQSKASRTLASSRTARVFYI